MTVLNPSAGGEETHRLNTVKFGQYNLAVQTLFIFGAAILRLLLNGRMTSSLFLVVFVLWFYYRSFVTLIKNTSDAYDLIFQSVWEHYSFS